MIEKYRLKLVGLKTQEKKLTTQIRQKEEMGEVLSAIDFDQLKIENQQYLERIEDRNKDLVEKKRTASNALLTLNNTKVNASLSIIRCDHC